RLSGARQQQGCWSWPQIIGCGRRRRIRGEGRDLRGRLDRRWDGWTERLVAEVPEGVVAATGELASDREDGELSVEALLHGPEVGVVGRTGPTGVHGRLVEGPAQCRRALSSEMTARSPAVRGVHRDIQAGVADGLTGVGEPPAVA